MKPTIGSLRNRIEIQAPTASQEDDGGIVEAWAAGDEVWASIVQLNGRELEIARQAYADVTHKMTIRYFEGLTNQHRILFAGRTFNIISVDNVEENGRWSVVMVKEQK